MEREEMYATFGISAPPKGAGRSPNTVAFNHARHGKRFMAMRLVQDVTTYGV